MTISELPELGEVVGEGWSNVGAGEDNGDNTASRGEMAGVNPMDKEWSRKLKDATEMLRTRVIEEWLTNL